MTPPFSRPAKLALALVLLGGIGLLAAILWIGRGGSGRDVPAPVLGEPVAEPVSPAPSLATPPVADAAPRAPELQPPAAPTSPSTLVPAFGPADPGRDLGNRIRARRAMRPLVRWTGQRPDGGSR
jgi:hypothetical protein